MPKTKKLAKTVKPKKEVVSEEPVVVENETEEIKSKKKVDVKKMSKYALILVGVAAILFGVYKYKGVLVAATVNGVPVSRMEVISELEKQGGNQVLQGVVRKKLLESEAKKKNIVVSQKDLDAKYTEIDAQFKQSGQSLDQYLASNKMDKQDFMKNQLKYEVILSKLVEDKVKVDAKEVDNFIEQNKDQFKDRNMDEVKKEVTETLKQNKLRMETGTYLDELVSKAKIDYFAYQK